MVTGVSKNKKVRIEVPVEIINKKSGSGSISPYSSIGWKFCLEDKWFGDYVYILYKPTKEQEAVHIKDALDQAKEGLKEACAYTLSTDKLERVLVNRLEDFYGIASLRNRQGFLHRTQFRITRFLLRLILRGK